MKFSLASQSDPEVHLKLSGNLVNQWSDEPNLYLQSHLNQHPLATVNGDRSTGRMNFLSALVTLFSQPP